MGEAEVCRCFSNKVFLKILQYPQLLSCLRKALFIEKLRWLLLKWLCIGLCKSPSQNEKSFLRNLSLAPNKVSFKYESIVLIEDFNLLKLLKAKILNILQISSV